MKKQIIQFREERMPIMGKMPRLVKTAQFNMQILEPVLANAISRAGLRWHYKISENILELDNIEVEREPVIKCALLGFDGSKYENPEKHLNFFGCTLAKPIHLINFFLKFRGVLGNATISGAYTSYGTLDLKRDYNGAYERYYLENTRQRFFDYSATSEYFLGVYPVIKHKS